MPPSPSLQADKATCGNVIVERTVDTRGLDGLVLCYEAADIGAGGGNDSVEVAYAKNPMEGPTRLFLDVDGPLPGVDDVWLKYCLELPEDALGKPAMLLRIALHSNDNGQKVLVDNVTLFGVKSSCVARQDLFFSPFDGCDTTGWSVSGTFKCPEPFAGDALVADGGSFAIERTLDLSGVQGNVGLSFSLATSGTGKDDVFTVSVNAGGTTTTVFHQNGALRTTPGSTAFWIPLAELVPAVRDNPSVVLRLEANSVGRNQEIALDNVRLVVVRGLCVPGTSASLSAISELGAGRYAFDMLVTEPMPLDVACMWAGGRRAGSTTVFVSQ